MKKYEVEFYRTQCGRVIVKAKNAKQAKELVLNGDYDPDNENVMGGDLEIHDVEEMKP